MIMKFLIDNFGVSNLFGRENYEYYARISGRVLKVEESLNLEELRQVNRYAESTKSLSLLPIVHERQTQRMKTRSEWFLNPKENVHWVGFPYS